MKKKRILIGMPLIILFLMMVMALKPITRVSLEDTEKITAIVTSVNEVGKTGDVSIQIQESTKNYYVNRGVQQGMDVEKLQEGLKGKEISIYYVRHWTPMDPFGKFKHISRISVGEEIIYDEISL